MIDLKGIETYPNGVFYVEVRPDDSVTRYNINWDDCADRIVDKIPAKYKDKLVGLKEVLINTSTARYVEIKWD